MDEHELARASAGEMFDADEASRSLGISVDGISAGHATARMTVSRTMLNGHGVCHGGYVFLLADTAFAVACNTYGEITLAAGADIVFVSQVTEGEELTAEAVERVRFARSGVYDVTVRRPSGEIVAEFRGRSRSTGRGR